jgi:hypothetical protein
MKFSLPGFGKATVIGLDIGSHTVKAVEIVRKSRDKGFDLRSPNFGPNYILEQVRACKEEGVDRFLIWNARNDYETSFRALTE